MRALIVDDSRFVRGFVRGLLEPRGFDCEEAADGQAALDLLCREKTFDLDLVDWNMPVMNGLEMLRHLRADGFTGIKVMMVTTEAENDFIVRAPARHLVRYFEHVGEDWVTKPEIRQLCNFRQANLCQSPLPFQDGFDVIFLRNVMLYFSHETRRTLLAAIHRLLAPDGVLFLGSAEQPADPSILAGSTGRRYLPFPPSPLYLISSTDTKVI